MRTIGSLGRFARIFLGFSTVWMMPLTGRAQETGDSSTLTDFLALREKLAQVDKPLMWVITGDSITQGAKWLGQERSYPELLQERMRWELKRRRDLFVNSAISGEKTAGLLADFDWRVLRFRPDVVSIMIGMNDATLGTTGRQKFEADLREMIERVRAVGAIPILHRTNPIDDENPGSTSRADLPAYNEVIGRVAQSTRTLLVDHWRHWRDERPSSVALRDWLADPIHPNAAGHRQLAIQLFRTLGCYDSAAASCQP
jgi:lysophospholipase L1-like esterase